MEYWTDLAAKAGRAAFEAGRVATPAADPAYREILADALAAADDAVAFSAPRTRIVIAVADAWSRAWHAANLAAPVMMEAA